MKKVYLVTGSPGSGKTTYVHEHAGKKDLIFDLDSINTSLGSEMHGNGTTVLPVALAMRKTAIECIANRLGSWENAYFISASSDRSEIETLCETLGATEIKMNASKAECKERVINDVTRKNKEEQLELVERWFANETPSEECKIKGQTKRQEVITKMNMEEIEKTEAYLEQVQQQADTRLKEIEDTYNRINAILNAPVQKDPQPTGSVTQCDEVPPENDMHTFNAHLDKQISKDIRRLDSDMQLLNERIKKEQEFSIIDSDQKRKDITEGYRKLSKGLTCKQDLR